MTSTTPASTSITERRTHIFEVADAEPTQTRSGVTFRPTELIITWTGATGEKWTRYADIAGPRLKKDGSCGKSTTGEALWARDHFPDWVQAAIDETRPTGDPR